MASHLACSFQWREGLCRYLIRGIFLSLNSRAPSESGKSRPRINRRDWFVKEGAVILQDTSKNLFEGTDSSHWSASILRLTLSPLPFFSISFFLHGSVSFGMGLLFLRMD
ncbi:hypothetical protein SUGI_0281190 [Cryptomeria japonica]|nr:hypothetical protein SUGI_0281190 [Cryptomeria japonica]